MKTSGFLALAAGALALAGCGSKTEKAVENAATDTYNAATGIATAPVSPAQSFADTAAASDAFEIATSKLASAKAQSAKVKAFASQMVTAHTASTEKLQAAAAALSPAITPNPTLASEQQAKLDELNTLAGADFDKAYAAAQVDAHTKALAALQDYAASGDVPQLKELAAKMVPTVTAHLNMAKGLKP